MMQPAMVWADKTNQTKQSFSVVEAQFSQTLDKIESTLYTLKQQLEEGQEIKSTLKALKYQRRAIKSLDISIKQNFYVVKQHLRQNDFSGSIRKRHNTQVANYRHEFKRLLGNLQKILNPKNRGKRQYNIDQALKHLKEKRGSKSRDVLPTDTAPFTPAPIKVRPPREKKEDFTALLYDRKPIQLAALTLDGGVLSNDYLPANTPQEQDLTAEEDAAITPEIQALADSLNKQPVAIYNWVHNNIDYVPSYGGLQGAAYTLKTRRGNAFDTASLLIALLRASEIPARYAYGTVIVPIDKMKTWVGDAEHPEAIINLLQQGGIPSAAIVEGGVIAHVKMEHVWVEAWVDYEPSRGAVNRVGDTWIPLDASFKRKDISDGIDWKSLADFDAAAFAAQLTGSSNYDASWVSAMDATLMQDTLQIYSSDLRQALIDTGKYDISLGELLGGTRLVERQQSLLSSGLPYRLLVQAPSMASLPDSLRYQYSLALYTGTTEMALGDSVIKHAVNLPELASQRVALSFVPANQEAIDLINSYLPEPSQGNSIEPSELPGNLPGYLIEVNAELSIDGNVIDTAGPFLMGSQLILENEVISPTLGKERVLSYPVAGEYRALGWNLQGGLNQDINDTADRLAATEAALAEANISELDRHRLSGDVLRASLQLYFAANDLYGGWQSRFSDALLYRAPSFGAASSALVTDWMFGIPRSVHFKGVALELDRLRVQAVSADDNPEATSQFKQQLGQLGSALAHVVLEQGFGDGTSAGISAVRAMAAALQNNQRIYSVTSNNASSILPGLGLDETLQSRFDAALAADWQLLIPEGKVSIGDWWGMGTNAWDSVSGNNDFPSYGDSRIAAGVIYSSAGAALGWSGLTPAIDPELFLAAINAPVSSILSNSLGMLPLLQDPWSIGLSDDLLKLIAGNLLEQQTASLLPNVLASQLWSGLLLDQLSLGQLLDPSAPEVSLNVSSLNIGIGESVTISVSVTDDKAVTSLSVTVNDLPLTLNANGEIVYTPERAGKYRIVAIARDQASNLSRDEVLLTVTDPTDTSAPVATINSLETDGIITEPTPIVATVNDANLVKWRLFMRSASDAENTLVASGSRSLEQQNIHTFDPTLLLNGLYILTLEAEDANGLKTRIDNTLRVEGEMKVGNFSIAFEDMTIPVTGIPITVTRSYDTRQKHKNLDFGYGWSVGYQDIRIDEAKPAGLNWQIFPEGGIFGQKCVRPNGNRLVSVNLPNGQVETFRAKAVPECSSLVATTDVHLAYEPLEGTYSRLEQTNYGLLKLVNGNIIDAGDPGRPADPSNYRLTTEEGIVYELNEDFGITRIIDLNNNILTFGKNGIQHSSGKAVEFERDAQDRITAIIAPDGGKLSYHYDAAGNLSQMTDQLNADTRFSYNSSHGLTDISDPRGIRVARNEYDDNGRLIAQIDADGNRLEFTHDIAGRREIVRDRNGNATLYTYDRFGNVLAETNAQGETTLHTYDNEYNELSRTDALGNTTEWTYDKRGNQLTEKDPLGNVTTSAYNSQNKLKTQTDAYGRVVINNQYKIYTLPGGLEPIEGELLAMTDALNNRTAMGYDGSGNLTQLTDALGNATRYIYSHEGFKLSETDADGTKTTYTHDASGNVLTETTTRTDENGNLQTQVTRYGYDAKGRVVETTDALGNITKTEYNAINKEAASVDAFGKRTTFDYDSRGNLLKTTYPDGTTATVSYDAEGNKLSDTDRAGRTTHYVYDKLNRLTETIMPDATPQDLADNPRTRTEYDLAGRVKANIDANGNRTTYGYDAAGRRTTMTDALGQVTAYAYNKNGEQTEVTDANAHSVKTVYDAAGRSIQTLFNDGTGNKTAYDALGRKISQEDQAGIATLYDYDALGRLTKVTDAKSNVTSYAYDGQGNKISQTDANAHATTWRYDDLGRVTGRTLPLGQSETLEYDKVGNLVRRTDFNGNVTTYDYEPLNNRLTQVNYADGSVESFVYDVLGNRTQVTQTDSNANQRVTRWQYDARDRLLKETKPDGTTLEYQYDANGNRTQVKLTPVGQAAVVTDYSYDVLNRLKTVTDANGVTSYAYDKVGNRSSVSYPNGTSQVYAYDALNRLLKLSHYDASGTLTQQYDYTLGATGRRTQIAELNNRVTQYSYDSLYRLTAEQISDAVNGDYSASYQYDPVGNRTYSTIDGVSTAYTYDANDRLLQQGGTHYSYDDNGNMLTETLDAEVTQYSYNSKDHLVNVDKAGLVTEYRYNANGIRNAKVENGGTTAYLVDENRDYAQVLLETNASQNIVYSYGDDLISQTQSGAAHFYHYDGLGSTRTLSDSSGLETDRYNYDAFGIELNSTGNTPNAYRFTGEQYDSGLDQYYLRARYYDPNAGRFMQMDTWMGNNQDPISLHKYLYANADPANYTDPTGNFSLGSVGATLNTISTLANIATTAYDIFQVATGEKEISARELGSAIILNLALKGGSSGTAKKFFSKLAAKFGCNSFTTNTLVNAKKGLVAIQDVKIGDFVWTYNEESQVNEYKQVTHLIKRTNEYRLIAIHLEDNSIIETTELHPFYSNGKWVDAKKLKVGDKLYLTSGKVVTIQSLSESIKTLHSAPLK